MSIYSEIKEVFPTLAVADISDYYTQEIAPAKNVYQGKPNWRRVTNTGVKKKSRNRALLNAAKVVCDKMAALTFSEQCEIIIDNEKYNELVHTVLEENAFYEKFPEWLSRAYAMGGGILKVALQEGEVQIEYLNADVFFPTKWKANEELDAINKENGSDGGELDRLFG